MKAFKRLLLENFKNFKIKSITSDFEDELLNAINVIFPKQRKIGCMFHYVKQLRLNLGKKD